MTPEVLKEYLAKVPQMPPDEQRKVLDIVTRLNAATAKAKQQTGFLDFVRAMWPGFVEGYHHKIMAEAFERVAAGTLKRLIINMAPRHTKSG